MPHLQKVALKHEELFILIYHISPTPLTEPNNTRTIWAQIYNLANGGTYDCLYIAKNSSSKQQYATLTYYGPDLP